LWDAPHENTVAAEDSPVILEVPTPTAEQASFRIVAYDIMAPGGQERFPAIRTWYGVNVENPRQSIFLDWTSRGFHASIRFGDEDAYFIDPLFRGNRTYYQSYFVKDFTGANEFSCSTSSENGYSEGNRSTGRSTVGDCQLRQYRTAIAVTGEYSAYQGASDPNNPDDVEIVQGAVVTSINRVNQVFTREISLRLQLVADNPDLYYYDADTDPYTGNNPGALLNQNINNVNDVIGFNNYDLGHIFAASFNSGIAFLRSSCNNSKAAGVTGRTQPEGDPFDIDYLAHEMGHQFGGNHTQNNSCNYNSNTGMEPGSASTIMGYAGICSPNIQTNSDDYFHGISVQEIGSHTELGSGTCGTIINTTLTNPSIMPMDNDTIPVGTPFRLDYEAEGTALSYCWEQWDPEQGEEMPPEADNTVGPLFRSFGPSLDSVRFFPRLIDLARNIDPTWEKLPSVSRDMEFQLTLRTSNAAYGCAVGRSKKLHVDEQGPFTITDPNNGNQLSAAQLMQVQWDVAATDQAPFYCDSVDILYSMDGGQNFTILRENTPNDGLDTLTIPDNTTNRGRIMVRAVDNVFFAISTQNFRVVDSTGTASVGISIQGDDRVSDCFSESGETSFNFLTSSSGGATAPLTFSATNLPPGVTASFSPNPVQPGGTVSMTLQNLNAATTGIYTLSITGSSTEATVFTQVEVEKTGEVQLDGPEQVFPLATADNEDLRPTLAIIGTGADLYEYQVATDPDYDDIIVDFFSADDTYTFPDYLTGNTVYYWRVRSSVGSCGFSTWSERSFTTGDCYVYSSTSDPIIISDGPPPNLVVMEVEVPDAGLITDIDLYRGNITHSYMADLEVELIAPNGTQTRLLNRECGGDDDFFLSLDQDALATVLPCPPVAPDLFIRPPNGNLDVFNNLPMTGIWKLEVDDNFNRDGGSLNGFSLKICADNFSALPVELLRFTATPNSEVIQLEWITEVEEDNYGFFVERSTEVDGTRDWQELGFVAASGLSSGNYQFTDERVRPNTQYYYRLRQVDVDGKVQYSPIRAAALEGNPPALELFPMPISQWLQYNWLSATASETPYEIIDLRGVKVASGVLREQGGNIDLSRLVTGLYFLRVPSETDTAVHRLIKL
ncbi:MAG: reprolysin-like metallopeptidase, partial [Bacteroidota bacterium]